MTLPTDTDVLSGVSYDEPRTTQEVADVVLPPDQRWPMRGTIRNRLYALADQGLVICDDERPMRWVRPDFALTAEVPLYFPPDPECYGCRGTGTYQGFGMPKGRICSCRHHETGECEPECCSPECQRRAELRGE